MNFLKFIELCFQTVVPGCEYNNYRYIKVIADRLEAASAGEVKRIIFNMPPRSMKSLCIDTVLSVNKKIIKIVSLPRLYCKTKKYFQFTSCIADTDYSYRLSAKVEKKEERNKKRM